MRFAIAAMVLAGFFFAIAASSKPPAPSAGVGDQKAQQQSKRGDKSTSADKGNGDGDALFISVEATETGKAESQEEAKEREDHTTNERGLTDWTRALAIFTALLVAVAIAQAGLFVFQLLVMRAGLRDSKLAAEAALTSAESAMRIERPWVLMDKFLLRGAPFYKPESFWQTDEGRNVAAKPPLVKFNWQNAGRSPAFLIGMKQKFFVMDKGDSLADHWTLNADDLEHEHALIPGGSYGRPIHFSTGLIQQVTWQKIVSGDCLLIFAAFMRYRDPFDKVHETAFCAQFSGLPKRPSWYQDCGGKEYNYQT
jgi:hypothetical protein